MRKGEKHHMHSCRARIAVTKRDLPSNINMNVPDPLTGTQFAAQNGSAPGASPPSRRKRLEWQRITAQEAVMPAGSSRVVYAAIAANFGIAVTKFAAAGLSGSSAMLSEAIHSVVDTLNQLLLLLGLRRSQQPPDEVHPFGHGKELYFWGLIVGILLFGVGGGMALFEGVMHLLNPRPLEDPFWAYLVLAVAAVFESGSLTIATRELLRRRGPAEFWLRVHRSKDPSVFTTFLEDLAALLGIAVAFLGVYLGHQFNNPYFDAIASLIIGVILSVVALTLVYESRGLLIGESTNPEIVRDIARIAASDPAVLSARTPLTMHFGPYDILLNLEVVFKQGISAEEQVAAVERIEKAIREKYPAIKRIFIEARRADAAQPQTAEQGQIAEQSRTGKQPPASQPSARAAGGH
jgi:cation diffusion facilitator family transporter